jgi:predicted MarR family transcription regulator
VWALELLLLMRRHADRDWAAEDLVRELRASTTLVGDNLGRLQRAGLVVATDDGRYRFSPAAPPLAVLCAELEDAYRQRPVQVINAIAAPPDKLQTLADAFRFKRDKN